MTMREARVMLVGIHPKLEPTISEWQLRFLEGPVSAVSYAFGIEWINGKATRPYTVKWLAELYTQYTIKSGTDLYHWSRMILDLYDVEGLEPKLKVAFEKKEAFQQLIQLKKQHEQDKAERRERWRIRRKAK